MTARSGREAPTLESVARRAGVSRATAGRVLAGSGRVSEPAREAVLRAAAELSYVPNRAARSLMTRRSDSIAFAVAEPDERFFADPYFALVLRGAHAEAAEHDVQLVFVVLSDIRERQRFERFARGGHIDGVVVASLHGADPLPARLAAAGVPVVLSGRPFATGSRHGGDGGVGSDGGDGGDVRLTYVDVDNHGGARAAARLLVESGRRRLATVSGPLDMPAAVDRDAGFRAELAARGLAHRGAVDGDFSVAGGRRAMIELLDTAPDLDAVFVANDLMAVGALQALAETGRAVPADVAVVGFDDIPLAASARPALTTVRQPLVTMGRVLAARLLEVVERSEPVDPVVLPTEIVRRASA
jgi:DNA-binding LacI/PurR family transcriptional regulator